MGGTGFPLRHDGIVIQIYDDGIGERTPGIDTETVPRCGYLLIILGLGIGFDQPLSLDELSQITGDFLPLLGLVVVSRRLEVHIIRIAGLLHIEAFPAGLLLPGDPILYPLVEFLASNHASRIVLQDR